MTEPSQAFNVLHVVDHSLPLHSGYAFRSLNILREQRSRGWQPCVVTSSKQGIYGKHSVPILDEMACMRALQRRVLDAANVEPPTVIHAHSPILNAFPALRVGKYLKVPVVYEIRALWEDAAVDHGSYGQDSYKYRLVRFLETIVCNRAAAVIVLSSGLQRDLVERGIPSEKMAVVGNGVNLNQFGPEVVDGSFRKQWRLERKRVVGFIGSFYRYEGLDLLIDAAARLCSRWPTLAVVLVGGGEMEAELKKRADDLGLGGRVIMPGRVPHHEIASIYASMDVLVYPRRSMRLTELVTPLKPLEAMAMGKPVIASDVGGHRELITHNETGLLFQPASVPALVDRLDQILSSEELRSKLSRQAVAWVRRKRSWKTLSDTYAKVYSKVVGNGKREA
jgi:PEP-CTERM/exosortase A-associated glycosyltransferase